MENYEVEIAATKDDVGKFLDLPEYVYTREPNPCNKALENELIEGISDLSEYFECVPFIVEDTSVGNIVMRAALFLYEKTDTAYIGLFEGIYDISAAQVLFSYIAEEAATRGRNKLLGPVNGSFWYGYRFRENKKYDHYTMEPFNKGYYIELWKAAGFSVAEEYESQFVYLQNEINEASKSSKRLARAIEAGYRFEHPSFLSFGATLKRVYDAVCRLYSTFPAYHEITFQQFKKLFSPMRFILDYDLVYEVFNDKGQYAAFMICVPDYGSMLWDGNFSVMNIINKKRKTQRYIIMYMGVLPGHEGLAGALAEKAQRDARKKSIHEYVAALIHSGKSTAIWSSERSEKTVRYYLMQRKIS